jgi:membrane-associated phospholipid phosphatase
VWRLIGRTSRFWLEYLELSYLLVYPLVPAAFAVLYFTNGSLYVDRFWTAVTLAVFSCYGLLPWLPSRPPRVVEGPGLFDRRRLTFRRLNLRVLQHGSVQWNTFPSGHAAGGVAAALSVIVVLPAAGVAILILAISVMAASVLGRYHYAADALAGAVVAVIATLLAQLTS